MQAFACRTGGLDQLVCPGRSAYCVATRKRAAPTICVPRRSDAQRAQPISVVTKPRSKDVLAALKEAGEKPVIIGDVTAPWGQKSDAKGKGEANAVKVEGKLG